MSLYGLTDKVPEFYIICLINSTMMSLYVDNYVNNTQTFQINDARQLPIIVPSESQLREFKTIFDRAVKIKRESNDSHSLNALQNELDRIVNQLYKIQ